MKKRYLVFAFLVTIISCNDTTVKNNSYHKVIDITYAVDSFLFERENNIPDFEAMKSSFRAVDNIYIMTFHGNFDELLSFHHKSIMEYFANQKSRERDKLNCSLFTYRDKTGNVFFGRNFDNRETGLLIGLFIPDSGYTSLGFVPMIEFKFDTQHPFDSSSVEQRNLLLHSAAATVDGINEKGVVVSVASIQKQFVEPDTSKPYRFLLHLKRNILDHAFDLNSAIDIAASYNVFDNSLHHISHHILIADSTGGSAVLEWHEGKMQVIRGTGGKQIATNTAMYNASEGRLNRSCDRFRLIHSSLANDPDTLSWQKGMDILAAARQVNVVYHFDDGPMRVSTQWSAVFEINKRRVTVCTGNDYSKAYRFKLHVKEFYRHYKN